MHTCTMTQLYWDCWLKSPNHFTMAGHAKFIKEKGICFMKPFPRKIQPESTSFGHVAFSSDTLPTSPSSAPNPPTSNLHWGSCISLQLPDPIQKFHPVRSWAWTEARTMSLHTHIKHSRNPYIELWAFRFCVYMIFLDSASTPDLVALKCV